MRKPICALAFSGGLDTSYCALLLNKQGYDVVTLTVDTGGFSPEELDAIEARSREVGAVRHLAFDAKQHFFDQILVQLIRGNVLRGNNYPLCVGAERVTQAVEVCRLAKEMGAEVIAHGSTGAGNDQMRFDVAVHVLAPQAKLLAPIREAGLTREATTQFLQENGVAVQPRTTRYSINKGLWGTTIGGGETHDSWQSLPEDAYCDTVSPANAPDQPEELTLTFEQGVPVALNGNRMAGAELVQQTAALGARHGIGRGMHLGTTVMKIKGRVAFEAPAPAILLTAHRELEKLVLTRGQLLLSASLSEQYGTMLHEGMYLDPVMRDIEAFWASSQQTVTGDVRVSLFKGQAFVLGVRSPFSLLGRGAKYGEEASAYNGRDAEGYCRISALELRAAQERQP